MEPWPNFPFTLHQPHEKCNGLWTIDHGLLKISDETVAKYPLNIPGPGGYRSPL